MVLKDCGAIVFLVPSHTGRDNSTTLSFLTARVKILDEDDWDRLRRLIQYLKGTRGLKVRLRTTGLKEMQ